MEKITKINYTTKAKFLILIPIIIFALAVMITCIFGINYARELQDRYEFTVDFGVEIADSDINGYVEKIQKSLENNELKAVEYKKFGQSIYTGLVLTIDNVDSEFTEEQIEDLQEKIELDLQESIANTVEVSNLQLIKSDITGFALKALLAFGVILVAIFVYLWIRFSFIMAISGVISSALSPALVFAIYGLFRLPFGYASLAIMFIAMIVSVITLIELYDKIKSKEMETQALTNNEYIYDAVDSSRYMLYMYLVCGLIIVGLIMMFVNIYLFTIFLTAGFAIIIALYSTNYIGTSFWSLVYNKEKDQRLRNRLDRAKKILEKKENKKKAEEKDDNDKVVV